MTIRKLVIVPFDSAVIDVGQMNIHKIIICMILSLMLIKIRRNIS